MNSEGYSQGSFVKHGHPVCCNSRVSFPSDNSSRFLCSPLPFVVVRAGCSCKNGFGKRRLEPGDALYDRGLFEEAIWVWKESGAVFEKNAT